MFDDTGEWIFSGFEILSMFDVFFFEQSANLKLHLGVDFSTPGKRSEMML